MAMGFLDVSRNVCIASNTWERPQPLPRMSLNLVLLFAVSGDKVSFRITKYSTEVRLVKLGSV